MANGDVAEHLTTIAALYEILSVQWKPRAFQKAARQVAGMEQDVAELFGSGGRKALLEIEGVGESISKTIEEFLQTGTSTELKELQKKIPPGVDDLLKVPGVGPKKALLFYQHLKVKSIDDLEQAIHSKKIRELPGCSAKTEENILAGIAFVKQGGSRKPLGQVLPLARKLKASLEKLQSVHKIEIGGSVRRRKETCGDIDLLVVSKKGSDVFDAFTKLPEVKKVIGRGDTKLSVLLYAGLNCDVRVVPDESFGAALQYFTGSKDHNVELRKRANAKGLKLSEYGLFDEKTGKQVAGSTEEDVYSRLGLPFLPPEIRECQGEFQLKNVPDLVTVPSIKGDLHIHTTWSDGKNTTEEVVRAAIQRGYEYIAITDHSVSERIQSGLDANRVKEHFAEIDLLRKKYPGIIILKGAEVDILRDGSLDYADEILASMDFVVASVHSNFKQPKPEMTARICRALSNKYVTVLGHPTGRVIGERPGYEFEFDEVLKVVKKRGIAFEVNAHPSRLDLSDINIRRAVDSGALVCISTDAHTIQELEHMEYGVSQARRGWATRSSVVNTLKSKEFLTWIKKTRTN